MTRTCSQKERWGKVEVNLRQEEVLKLDSMNVLWENIRNSHGEMDK